MAKANALAMLAIARRDLQATQGMTNTSTFHEAVWGFHVQQTVEEALKALLCLADFNPPFTHDLVSLFKLLQQAGIDINVHRDLASFTDFAVQIRYDEQPDLQDFNRLLWNAKAEPLVHGVVPVQWTGRQAACLTENEHHDPTTPPFHASAKGRGHCPLPRRGADHFGSIQTPWNSRHMLGPLDSASRD
jgi:HEPN domain-containing protein